jgi:hypothetical protein
MKNGEVIPPKGPREGDVAFFRVFDLVLDSEGKPIHTEKQALEEDELPERIRNGLNDETVQGVVVEINQTNTPCAECQPIIQKYVQDMRAYVPRGKFFMVRMNALQVYDGKDGELGRTMSSVENLKKQTRKYEPKELPPKRVRRPASLGTKPSGLPIEPPKSVLLSRIRGYPDSLNFKVSNAPLNLLYEGEQAQAGAVDVLHGAEQQLAGIIKQVAEAAL